HFKLTAKKDAFDTVGIWIERQQLGALFAGMSTKPSAVSQTSHSANHPVAAVNNDQSQYPLSRCSTRQDLYKLTVTKR
ncbi:MAG: hypothetical protein KBT59_08585, partial [Sphingomonadales bacterium]|nr:hypothetical protein [Sphingomonadales bacterium]